MLQSINNREIAAYVTRQINMFYPDNHPVTESSFIPYVEHAMKRVEFSFSHIKIKYYFHEGKVVFNHLNTDQYATFLCFLASSIFNNGGPAESAAKVYSLNKALHGLEVFYEIQLPKILLFSHPVGAVLGRAHYGNYLLIHQNCTVGGNLALEYPIIGDGVLLYGGSAILGKSIVGSNTLVGYGAVIKDTNIPQDSLVFGQSPNNVLKPHKHNSITRYFRLENEMSSSLQVSHPI